MYDATTGTLFSADAFGYLFPASADLVFDDELDGGIPGDWLRRYHVSAFRFLPLVRGAKVNADIARVFAGRDVRILAPTHGNAVRGDVARLVDRFNKAVTAICR